MNRAWIIRAEERIARLEQHKREMDLFTGLLLQRIQDLEREKSEAEKRGPGRPRKVEAEA